MLPRTGTLMLDADPRGLIANGWIAATMAIERWFYWESIFWDDDYRGGHGPIDPFVTAESFHNADGDASLGDGILLYPGRQQGKFAASSLGTDAVFPSIRLKAIRRGIQDAGLIALAARERPEETARLIARALPSALDEADLARRASWETAPLSFEAGRAALRALVTRDAPMTDAEIRAAFDDLAERRRRAVPLAPAPARGDRRLPIALIAALAAVLTLGFAARARYSPPPVMSFLHYGLIWLVLVYIYIRARDREHARRFSRWAIIAAGALVVLSPFVWLVPAVFKSGDAFNDYVFFPPLEKWSETMTLANFRKLGEGRPSLRGQVYFWEYFLNSTVVATVTTTLQIFFSSLAGYALAKFEFRGKAALTLFMLGSMMIPSVLLLAPLYKMVVDLGLVDSLAGVIIPLMVSTYGIFLFRQACVTVPNEMLDAARLDGCSEFGIYFRVVMPLVRPMAAAFCLVAFLANWNAFFQPNIFLHSEDNLTVPVVLNLLLGVYRQKQGIYLAGTALAMIPPAVLFFFLQKEFISGLTSGAVKG